MKKFILSMFILLLTTTLVSAEQERKVKVSSNDSTAGYLNGKLVAGSNVSFVEGNDGTNETLTINSATTGSGVVLDLADDSSNESSGINEIATTGDTNSIFGEPIADKLLVDLTKDWPKADTADALFANGANCSAGNSPLGVDASGAAEGCFDIATQTELNTHTSATSAHGVTGSIVGSSDSQTLTNKSISGLTNTITNLDDDQVLFDDADSNFIATTIGAAIEELDNVNGSGVNAADGKVEWSQLVGVPAGFADGTDASASGYDTIQDEGSSITQRSTVNFTGAGVSCVDTGVKSECTIAGSGSATFTTQENDTNVDAATSTLDFGSGFDLTSSPAGEANVVMDLSENVSGDVTFNTSNVSVIGSDAVALTTDTTGNYVASITNGTSITGGNGGSEGAALTLDVADDSINGTELADAITVDGSNLQLGDGGSNYTQVGTNGLLTYAGTAKPARTIILTATGAILPSANFPETNTIGSNVNYKVLDFDDSTDESIYYTFIWPDSWDGGTITARIRWQSTATTGDTIWALQTACVADAEAVDATLNSDSSVTDTAKGTANQLNDADVASVTITGCAAGELVHVKIRRDADNGSDTMTGDARYIYAKLEYQANAESD